MSEDNFAIRLSNFVRKKEGFSVDFLDKNLEIHFKL
jgi:hypothetical protein